MKLVYSNFFRYHSTGLYFRIYIDPLLFKFCMQNRHLISCQEQTPGFCDVGDNEC